VCRAAAKPSLVEILFALRYSQNSFLIDKPAFF